MKLISTLLGRVIFSVPVDEMLPQGGVHLPDVLPMLTERYGFLTSPSLSDSLGKVREQGMRFETGKFRRDDGEDRVVQDLTVWNEGIVASTSTTEDAEELLNDFLTWGRDTLRFRLTPEMVTMKLFLSQVVVEFERPISLALRSFEAISGSMNDALRSTYQTELPAIELSLVHFDYDREIAPSAFAQLSRFGIERRGGHPYTDSVFFCQAPLPTREHLRVLEEMEALLTD
ncbi:MAG TPA: hypothetical protein VJH03_10680 [Blastocatellia bacterium]|nr:hypothetical protein [Blastocatellia bacterium]